MGCLFKQPTYDRVRYKKIKSSEKIKGELSRCNFCTIILCVLITKMNIFITKISKIVIGAGIYGAGENVVPKAGFVYSDGIEHIKRLLLLSFKHW